MNTPREVAEKFILARSLTPFSDIDALTELLQATWDQSAKRTATRNWVEDGRNFTQWLIPPDFDLPYPDNQTLPLGDKSK